MRLPRARRGLLADLLAIAWLLPASVALAQAQPSFLTFESGQVRPLALSPDGTRLFAVNTPDNLGPARRQQDLSEDRNRWPVCGDDSGPRCSH